MKKFLFSAALLGFSISASAQLSATATQQLDIIIPTYSGIALETEKLTFDFTGDAPTVAGNNLGSAQKLAETYLKISNMDQYDDQADTKVSLTMSNLNPGLTLKLQVLAPGANAKGDVGDIESDFAAPFLLANNTADDIVTGIGTCYTGSASSDGYNLKYTLDVTGDGTDIFEDIADGNANAVATQIVYTISN
ncbi:hypothetical protein OAQ85_02870 [Schleiferiaceae bacterium]|nr:hypothetical protein [Flavobacteriales bacterium]MDC1022359.1 hypothetical protein [Schleiferiaceae bacterium]|tara:strand:+ start:1402 stop:1980 length:579 start_codon:yes stop_codon:yes gene_type:complete